MTKRETIHIPLHLSAAHLAGYKTVKNVQTDFLPGLNIIIGKNGVGKTNFLYALNKALNFDYENDFGFIAKINLVGENINELISVNQKVDGNIGTNQLQSDFNIYVTHNDDSTEKFDTLYGLISAYRDSNYFWADFLNHGIHFSKKILFDLPLSFGGASFESVVNSLFHNIETESSYFLKSLLINLLQIGKLKTVSEAKLQKEIRNRLDLSFLNEAIKNLTPIEDVRLKNGFQIFITEGSKEFRIENLLFEFNVNGDWFPYSALSDGTKRVFQIVADIVFPDLYTVGKGTFGEQKNIITRIILVEEPELGIHPHQLNKLMRFIKEQSEKRQIIITTHSPDVLDVLGKDDLDRIILADYDVTKGTQLRHLTNDEKKKATTFLENEAFLSDYWKHSTLEAR